MMNCELRDQDDDRGALAIMTALRTALPTSRHAEMLVDGVVAEIGDAAVVETAAGGTVLRLFRRDLAFPAAIVPWPLLRLARGEHLSFVMGVGPPTNQPPRGRHGPPLRLSGLTSGELELTDGSLTVTLTYGEDGRVAETCRGWTPGALVVAKEGLARGDRNAVEVVVEHVARLDLRFLGPGRLVRLAPAASSIEGACLLALNAVRDALLDEEIPADARWPALDGYAAEVMAFGATRAEALDGARTKIERCRPGPMEPEPPPAIRPFHRPLLRPGSRWSSPRGRHGAQLRQSTSSRQGRDRRQACLRRTEGT